MGPRNEVARSIRSAWRIAKVYTATTMETLRIQVDPDAPDPEAIAQAARVLVAGGLVALPTETVYGLGALADDPTAVARIFAAKGRPGTNPLIVHVLDEAAARQLVRAWPPAAAVLTHAFWPGPLTVVVPRDPARIPDIVTGGGNTVALRAPAHPVARALLAATGRPLAAPSANPFQSLSATTADHVVKGLGGRIAMVLDGGPCAHGIESTVVDVTVDPPVVLRLGALSLAALRAVYPSIALDVAPHAEDVVAPSPGMLRRHYSPRARFSVVPVASLANAVADTMAPVGVLVRAPTAVRGAIVRVLPNDPVGYAAGLFAALHALDDLGCVSIVATEPPDDPAWAAVRDRLTRAGA